MNCPEYETLSEFYDFVVPYRDRPDVGFYVEQARSSGGPVLEIGCGTGRLLLPVGRAGIDAVGLDLSRSMLEQCRRRLAAEAPDVRRRIALVESDMRAFDLGRRFPLITIPFRAFQHLLSVDDQLATLSAVRRHLIDEGRLVLDLFDPSLRYLADPRVLTHPAVEPEFELPDGRRVERSSRLLSRNLANQTIDVEITYRQTLPNGLTSIHRDQFFLRYLFRFEAEHLLARAGFSIEAVYGGYASEPVGTYEPGDLVFVARLP